MGTVIAPCAVKPAAEIVSGATQTMLTRTADVTPKEHRRLVLMDRESPLHTGHLRTLAKASEIGAIIMPSMPAFYPKPASIEDMDDHTVGRTLDLFGIANSFSEHWTGKPAWGPNAINTREPHVLAPIVQVFISVYFIVTLDR